MGAFGDISLANKFGIVLGCLIVLVFGAGLVKLYLSKRRLKKDQKIADVEAKGKLTDREKLVGSRNLGEGDLFGVRAIEAGYFGGVSQSRPSSPAPSSYKLAPDTTVVDWGQAKSDDDFGSIKSSVTSILPAPQPVKKKPSPLTLSPFDAELKRPGGAGTSPLPSPRSVRSANSGWVSPLDVHFSRPSTPQASEKSRPTSYLPRLQFPEGISKNGLLMPTPADALVGAKSESASIASFETSSSTLPHAQAAAAESRQVGSPSAPTFSPALPSASGEQRSIFPTSNDMDRPSSRRSNKSFKNFPIPPLPQSPQSYFPPSSTAVDPNLFPESPRWNSESAVFRESIVSKRSVSVYRPKSSHSQSPGAVQKHNRTHSGSSSVYSARTSIVDENGISHKESRKRSRSTETPAQQRNRSRSTSKKRSGSLARAQDSLKRHSRKVSQDSMKGDKRRSRDRDQIHFDPSQHNRNRSGSVQGRAVDFDKPRESPFSNANAISTHSTSSSLSSSSSSGIPPQQQIPKPFLDLNLPLYDRLSVMTTGAGRYRSASEVSQGSIGEFYDAYYRQSILAQRASVANQGQGLEMRNLGIGLALSNAPGRLVPSSLKLGGGTLAAEPIVELPSPVPSPMIPRVEERFPSMI